MYQHEDNKFQIFKLFPNDELYYLVLSCFGIKNTEIFKFSFTKKMLIKLDTIKKIIDIIDRVKSCYLPCKARSYLYALDHKNIITILRHFLRTRNLKIISTEKYDKGEKYIVYQIVKINIINSNTNKTLYPKFKKKIEIIKKNYTIEFN